MVRAVVEKLEKDMVKIEVEVDTQEFEQAVQQVYNKNKGHFAIPGFRKGKAPRKIIEKYAGEGVFHEDAFKQMFPSVYYKALVTNNIEPADEPDDVAILQIGNGQNLIFSVRVQVEPTPELGAYKGIDIDIVPDALTDKEIEDELKNIRTRHARWLSLENEGAMLEDSAIVSISAHVDGEKVESISSDRKFLTLGGHNFLPGLDEHLLNMKTGEQKQIQLLLPDDFDDAILANKDAILEVKLLELKRKELPDLDDEFAKDISEYNTISEFTENLRTMMQQQKIANAKNRMAGQLMSKICIASTVDIPESMIDYRVSRMLDQSEQNVKKQFGLTLEEMDKNNFLKLHDLKEDYKETAKAEILEELVLKRIAAVENIESTDEEIGNALPKDFRRDWADLTVEDGRDFDYVRSLKEVLTRKKTIEFLMDNAIIVESNSTSDAGTDDNMYEKEQNTSEEV